MHGSERSLILKEKFMAEVSGPIEVVLLPQWALPTDILAVFVVRYAC
jgi:hypothetical protein